MDSHTNNPDLSTKPSKPFSACCFRPTVIEDVPPASHHQSPIGVGEKKKKRWFPNLSMKKPPSVTAATKTFPLDSYSLAEETNGSDDNNSAKECDHNKSKFNRWKANCIVSSRRRQTPDETTGISTESPENKNTATAGKCGASEDRGDVVTCKKRLFFRRKKSETTNGDKNKSSGSCSRSHPNSLVSTSNSKVLNASVLAPRPTVATELDDERIEPLTAPNNDKEKEERKLGSSVVGMSMIVVTLVIMVVWGRFCAIVWTSAWLYLVPRLRTFLSEVQANANRGKNNSIAAAERLEECELGGSSPDLDSAEYKRRVVLEGFLERNRRLSTA